jgi:hypothetical protein
MINFFTTPTISWCHLVFKQKTTKNANTKLDIHFSGKKIINNIVALSKYCLQAYMLAEIFAYKGKSSLHSSGIKIPNLSMILGIIIIIIPFHLIVIYFTKNMIEVWY